MDVPRSEMFDDVYFSEQDGLAESIHVFLDGNGLPDAWAGREQFTICETGFGTGLNLLAVAKLWKESPDRPKKLRFISFEKYPLEYDYIGEQLARWDGISEVLEAFLPVYREGVFSFLDGIEVQLIFDDVNKALPCLTDTVDCWFLDGFKPSSNPDMWSETVFSNMARLSYNQTTFATFTAAGFVRRGLAEQGFHVRKVAGFGRKREMIVGHYED